MYKYFGYMPNDFINGEGISVSLWVAGCPHKCLGCHNSEMWDYDNGFTVPADIKNKIKQAIFANGIIRNFSILGGEPLAPYNIDFVYDILKYILEESPNSKIFLWTGYSLSELQLLRESNIKLDFILNHIYYLIDGRYIQEQRDVSLWLRGSSNQNIYKLTKDKKFVKINNKGKEKDNE